MTAELNPEISRALEEYKPQLVERYSSHVRKVFKLMVEDLGPSLKGVYNSYRWARTMSAEGMIRKNLTVAGSGINAPYEINEEALAKNAALYAENSVKGWAKKIHDKLGRIENVEVTYLNGDSFDIKGERNGHKIIINQTVIIKTSPKNVLFNQFPSRIYVDGKFTPESKYKEILSAPSPETSEGERMNPAIANKDSVKALTETGFTVKLEPDNDSEWTNLVVTDPSGKEVFGASYEDEDGLDELLGEVEEAHKQWINDHQLDKLKAFAKGGGLPKGWKKIFEEGSPEDDISPVLRIETGETYNNGMDDLDYILMLHQGKIMLLDYSYGEIGVVHNWKEAVGMMNENFSSETASPASPIEQLIDEALKGGIGSEIESELNGLDRADLIPEAKKAFKEFALSRKWDEDGDYTSMLSAQHESPKQTESLRNMFKGLVYDKLVRMSVPFRTGSATKSLAKLFGYSVREMREGKHKEVCWLANKLEGINISPAEVMAERNPELYRKPSESSPVKRIEQAETFEEIAEVFEDTFKNNLNGERK